MIFGIVGHHVGGCDLLEHGAALKVHVAAIIQENAPMERVGRAFEQLERGVHAVIDLLLVFAWHPSLISLLRQQIGLEDCLLSKCALPRLRRLQAVSACWASSFSKCRRARTA